MFLTEINLNDTAEIKIIDGPTKTVARLNELGLRPGKIIHLIQKTPLNGPIIIQIDNSLIALRHEEIQCIYLR